MRIKKTIVGGLFIGSFLLLGGMLWPQQASQQNGFSSATNASEALTLGTLSGVVISLGDGTMIPRATVMVANAQVETDLDGLFSLDVAPGTYEIQVQKEGYIGQKVQGVEVGVGETVFQDIGLNPQALEGGSVTVVADAEAASRVALLAERRTASVISDSVGSQEISSSTAFDAADAMQRVTGVSIVDSKYVYVRGLGERYSATMLNGSMLPSTQPDRKVVPMDLFPTSLLENIHTEKSYTPDRPGEFSGGLVRMNTIDFPRAKALRPSYSQGFDTNTTFQDFRSYSGGGSRWWGSDYGTRALPSVIPNQRLVRGSRFTEGGFRASELEQFGEAFNNTWSPRIESARPNQKLNFVAGNTFGPLGVVFALSHGNSWHNQQEESTVFRVARGGVSPQHQYDFDISRASLRTGATCSLAYRLSDRHQLAYKNFWTHDTSDETRIFQGFNSDIATDIRNTRLRFTEESIYSGQVSGEHSFDALGNSLFEWQLGRSRSTLDEPDLRETLYEYQPHAIGLRAGRREPERLSSVHSSGRRDSGTSAQLDHLHHPLERDRQRQGGRFVPEPQPRLLWPAVPIPSSPIRSAF